MLRGGVTAYAAQVKRDVLGVDADLLARVGTVDEEVCRQMCLGAARLLGADHAVATTGVAGPGPAEGHAAGTVWIGAIGPRVQATRRLVLAGPRVAVRPASAAAVLALLSEVASGNTGAVHAIDWAGPRACPTVRDTRGTDRAGPAPVGRNDRGRSTASTRRPAPPDGE